MNGEDIPPLSDTAPPGCPRPPNELVAGRYKLLRALGAGGNGEVWRGDDLVSGTAVAVKLLYGGSGASPARVRREVSALRLLRLPGVVRLLDEGTDGDQPFLVMELVEGTPFPGEVLPCAWGGIAGVTVALLETLARVHAAGVVHRDLKPANVLVSASGLPTVLDFGLSYGLRMGDGITQEGVVVGTPAYLAPEQLLGEPITPRTDLYAVGLMLYQALAGELPHASGARQKTLIARVARPAPPLQKQAPHTPALVAGVVDMLLARAPDERPRSAVEVLAMLRGEIASAADSPLARLDGDAPVEALLARAGAGQCADLIGPRGSGRSRCLREVSAALAAQGRRAIWARPSRQPFEGVEEVVAPLPGERSLRIADLVAIVDARIEAALAGGIAILADDTERLDPWSAAALGRCRAKGAVLRAMTAPDGAHCDEGEVVRLEPIGEAALAALFAGRERIFHLRSDAARVLAARTGGLQARVAHEVTAWVRAGLARWSGDRLAIDRDALDRLDAGLRVATPWALADPSGAHPPASGLSAQIEELCVWIDLAWPSTDPELLAQVMDLPVWRVQAFLEELIRRGAARVLPDGRVELDASVRVDDDRPPEARRAAHRAIAAALPEGADGRLIHLLAGAEEVIDAAAIAREAEALALRLAREGRVGRAIAALDEGLRALRRSSVDATAEEERLLAAWVEIALPTGGPPAKDRVLYEICRTRTKTESLARLEDLVRASLAYHAGGERARELLDALAPFGDLRLERVRQGARVQAARRCSLETEEAVSESVVIWARSTGDTLTTARAAGWLGRLRYRQGRFDEAASFHAEAEHGETWAIASINARLNRASALLEAFRFVEAGEHTRAALRDAAACRHAFFEARAEWLVRAVAYRLEEPLSPDRELIEAVAELGVPDIEALICMNEAAIAYRTGDLAGAAEIADRAHRLWSSIGDLWPAFLLRALALAAGAETSYPGEAKALGERALRCPVQGMGVQTLALVARALGRVPPAWKEGAPSLVDRIPSRFHALRMDILSVDEALELLGVIRARGATSTRAQ